MTDTTIVSDKDVESPDKDVESPISKDGSEESRNKLKDLDKKTVKFAGYMFWAILFIAAVATTSVLLNRPKEPNPDPESSSMSPSMSPSMSSSKISNPALGEVILRPGDYLISGNEKFIFMHDDNNRWAVKDYPDKAKTYLNLNRFAATTQGEFEMTSEGKLVLKGLWSTARHYETTCGGERKLELENDGNLVYKCNGVIKWDLCKTAEKNRYDADCKRYCETPIGKGFCENLGRKIACLTPQGFLCENLGNKNACLGTPPKSPNRDICGNW